MEKRRRLEPETRRGLLMDAAEAIVLGQGYLPVSTEKLSQAASVSKGLIYVYFATQADLFNAVLARQFEALRAAGLEAASRHPNFAEAAKSCALIYFEHVAAAGPLVHIILRDHYMAGRLDDGNRRFRDRIIGRLARQARAELLVAAKENIAAINMAITIPEEAGRLVHAGEMDLERARGLCVQLVASTVAAFQPARS